MNGGGARCKMANNKKSYGVLFAGVEWNSSPVTFHDNKGKNVSLTEDNRVATRVDEFLLGFAVVFTAEPLRVGQLFKVTMTKRAHR